MENEENQDVIDAREKLAEAEALPSPQREIAAEALCHATLALTSYVKTLCNTLPVRDAGMDNVS